MASKAVIMLGVLLVVALFVTSQVASEETEVDHEVQDFGGGGRGGGFGHGGGRGGGGFGHGGGRGRGGFGRGGGRGHCRFGCCRRGFRGGCTCCVRPDEVPEPMYLPEMGN